MREKIEIHSFEFAGGAAGAVGGVAAFRGAVSPGEGAFRKRIWGAVFVVVCLQAVLGGGLHAGDYSAAGARGVHGREVASDAQRRPGRLDEATIAALKQKAFELAISPGQDPEAVKAVFSLVLKARDQDLDAEKLKLDWERFTFNATEKAMAALEELRAIRNDSSLSTPEKAQRAKEILFGKRPEGLS
jgi:hypothetical protein